jgi:Spy/CpxP family protein refolding chaperone
LLAQRQKVLQRQALLAQMVQLNTEEAALRELHPDGHPDLAAVRHKLAELRPQVAADRVEQWRAGRAMLLKQIQDPATPPALLEEARRSLEKVEQALAREGAVP